MLILEHIYSMINIEDLIHEIFASPLFKRELQCQLKECIDDRQEESHTDSREVTLPNLVQEITGYISQITEIALEEENSKNYISFMRKNEELCLELEKKINAQMRNSVEQLESKIQAMSLKLNQIGKATKRTGAESNRLKDERKMITQSILETSRLQNSSSVFSAIQTKSQVHFSKQTTSYDDLPESNDTNSSLSMEMEKVKLVEMEKECKKCLQAWWTKVEAALEGARKSGEKVRQECTAVGERVEAKLEGNLESLWNVISDLCSRISKFESMEHLFAPLQA